MSIINKVSGNRGDVIVMKAIILMAIFIAGMFATGAFAQNRSFETGSYAQNDGYRQQSFRVAEVIDTRQVSIKIEASNDSKTTGSILGGLLGALGGQVAGQGNGRYVAAAVLGTAGAIGGRAIGDYVSSSEKQGQEITIVYGDGTGSVIVQEGDSIMVGDKVRVISGSAGSRVVKLGLSASNK